MVNPSYNGSFKFPSSTRSTGARKGGAFSRGNRQHIRQYNFYKNNQPSRTSSTGQTVGDDDDCPPEQCYNSFFNQCCLCGTC